MSFPPGVGCVAGVASAVLHSWSDVLPWYSMYPPSFTLLIFFMYYHPYSRWHKRFLLNSKCTSIAVCADIVGFLRQGLSIFMVIVACGLSWHHIGIGKRVSVLENPTIKWSFHVLMSRSAALTRWICGVTNCYSIYFCLLYLLRIADASLYIQWTRGIYPILVRCYTCLV